jgi:hypothetical protein
MILNNMIIKNIIIILFPILLNFSCSTQTNKLEEKKQTIKLEYIAWACECANWATPEDVKRINKGDPFSEKCVFIEPANSNLILPDTIGYSNDIVEFTGQFYIYKGYPNNYHKTEQDVEKAKVFRYTNYKIIVSNYKYTKIDSIEQ